MKGYHTCYFDFKRFSCYTIFCRQLLPGELALLKGRLFGNFFSRKRFNVIENHFSKPIVSFCRNLKIL